MRPVGFIHGWRPHPETRALIDSVRSVLTEYEPYGPLTLRQIFYRLVGTIGYEKSERAYKKLGEKLQVARRARWISFGDIRDDGDSVIEPDGWHSSDALMATIGRAVEAFHLYPDIGQPFRIMLLCEAAGMVPMLGQIVARYGVIVRSSGGFSGVASKHALAEDIAGHFDRFKRPTAILHIGDYDPSGEHIFLNLQRDVGAFLDDITAADVALFERIAVTPEQIERFGLPAAPAKATDNRSFAGLNGDGTSTVQAEALSPGVLAEIVDAAIRAYWRPDIASAVKDREAVDRAELGRWLGKGSR
ncbi:hypothetical protein [Rhizobium mayense]|uniref:DUF2399 domain-containing protein n=1 Tax=Rhizobium mayense TaxID=1312184 RepID=A0ABT7JQ08_9HYPH|nr:hypothetical protein [Rhizobium mayense]MDL2398425.1 hypothetical protein [Rhizobium mayense]